MTAIVAIVVAIAGTTSPSAARHAAPSPSPSPSPTASPSPSPSTTPVETTPPMPAFELHPELFDIPLTFDLPVSAPTPMPEPVIVPPAGFLRIPTAVPPGDTGHFVVTMKWVKVVGPHVHVVLLGRTTSHIFEDDGDDISHYVPLLVSGLRGANPHFTLVGSHHQTICDGRDGYIVSYVDRSLDPLAASVVFSVAGDTAWTAIYEHDAAAHDLPAGVASIDSLCPPLGDDSP